MDGNLYIISCHAPIVVAYMGRGNSSHSHMAVLFRLAALSYRAVAQFVRQKSHAGTALTIDTRLHRRACR